MENKKGYEVSAEQAMTAKIQANILNDVKLRQWCVERAIESGSGHLPNNLMHSSQVIFDFITARETKERAPVTEPDLDLNDPKN